jgi:hypothetical protein
MEEDDTRFNTASDNLNSKLNTSKPNFRNELLYKRDSFGENFIPERIKTGNCNILALK